MSMRIMQPDRLLLLVAAGVWPDSVEATTGKHHTGTGDVGFFVDFEHNLTGGWTDAPGYAEAREPEVIDAFNGLVKCLRHDGDLRVWYKDRAKDSVVEKILNDDPVLSAQGVVEASKFCRESAFRHLAEMEELVYVPDDLEDE